MSTFEKYTAEQRAAISDSLPGGASDEIIERLESAVRAYQREARRVDGRDGQEHRARVKKWRNRLGRRLESDRDPAEMVALASEQIVGEAPNKRNNRDLSMVERSMLADLRSLVELRGGDPNDKTALREALGDFFGQERDRNPARRRFFMEVVAVWRDATGAWPSVRKDVESLGVEPAVMSFCRACGCPVGINQHMINRDEIIVAREECKDRHERLRRWAEG